MCLDQWSSCLLCRAVGSASSTLSLLVSLIVSVFVLSFLPHCCQCGILTTNMEPFCIHPSVRWFPPPPSPLQLLRCVLLQEMVLSNGDLLVYTSSGPVGTLYDCFLFLEDGLVHYQSYRLQASQSGKY